MLAFGSRFQTADINDSRAMTSGECNRNNQFIRMSVPQQKYKIHVPFPDFYVVMCAASKFVKR